MNLKFCCIIYLLLNTMDNLCAYPKVTSPFGNITGFYKLSQHRVKYKAFEGIPFALPPIGDLRFEPPVPALPMKTEYYAKQKKSSCWQYQTIPYYIQESNTINDVDTNPVLGSEDCLYLNIYVPLSKTCCDNHLFPVLIFIYGGSFKHGSADDLTERYIIEKDVVFVTFNYRLGPLGFLSTEDDVVPGNMGLKDQSLAIRWVKNNILFFGGDPNNIVLAGISAGGTSVNYHYLSPMSRGLFHGGISLSGTVFSAWTQEQKPFEKAKNVSLLLGCPINNTKEMIRCLKQKPARDITKTITSLLIWLIHPDIMFGPVVEKYGDNPFINQLPGDIINSGLIHDVPWVNSVVHNEGTWTAADFILQENLLNELNDNWNNLIPAVLDYKFIIPPSDQDDVSIKIRKEYFRSLPINSQIRNNITQMIGDRRFYYPAFQVLYSQAEKMKSPIFFMRYSYRAAHSASELLSGSRENLGVSHTDDAHLAFQFDPLLNPETTSSDLEMQSSVLDMWKTFIYTKKLKFDSVECRKFDPKMKPIQFCDLIGPHNVSISTSDNFGNNRFWQSLNFNGKQSTN